MLYIIVYNYIITIVCVCVYTDIQMYGVSKISDCFLFFFFFLKQLTYNVTNRIYKRKLKHQTPLAVTLYMDKNIKALY